MDMFHRYIALIATIALSSAHWCSGQETLRSPQDYPTIPISALDRYQASIVEEQVELMRIPRLRLDGRHVFVMNLIDGHLSIPTDGQCSTRLENRHAPDIKVEFLAFPESSFEYTLNDETLNLYLEGLQLRHKPEQAFKILEPSAFTERGPSKFRIMGQRAMTIRYSLQTDGATTVYGENWIKRDGSIYIVRTQAPQRVFSRQYEDVRIAFNSMSELE
jgi:hypothetical protein